MIEYYTSNSLAWITLNRPEKRNALSRELIASIYDAFAKATNDNNVRVVVLSGNGSAFCAGMDLDELRSTIGSESNIIWDDAQKLSQLYQRIYDCPKPTIAAVNGAAVAGGAGLMTVCDLAISVPTAKFGYPEVRRGLVAAMVMPHLLRHVGERTARWLLLTGELINATEAERVGLINRVVEAESLHLTVEAIANTLIEGGPQALATTKSLLRRCSTQALSVEELASASAEPRLTTECHDGLTAFFEKRPPPWMK